MNIKHAVNSFFFALLLLITGNAEAQQISLAGQWRFAVDAGDIGAAEKWFAKKLTGVIQLPGSMAENRKGDDVTLQTKWTGTIYDSSFYFTPRLAKYRKPGNIHIPFWLTPAKHYVGVAWYQKEIEIPVNWNRKRISLFLERCHIETRVWIDEIEVGKSNSLVAPHEFDLTKLITPGKHRITISVDNRIKEINVGPDSHSIADHTQGNWNGIIGKMYLKAESLVSFNDIQVYPDIKSRSATVRMQLLNTTQEL